MEMCVCRSAALWLAALQSTVGYCDSVHGITQAHRGIMCISNQYVLLNVFCSVANLFFFIGDSAVLLLLCTAHKLQNHGQLQVGAKKRLYYMIAASNTKYYKEKKLHLTS